MRSLLIAYFGVFSVWCWAQEIPENHNEIDSLGLRQGTWTLLFDQHWNLVKDLYSVAFYRVITYQDDVPQDTVRDFYRSGQLQWKGRLLADRPEDIMDGEVTWYGEGGLKEATSIFHRGELMTQYAYDESRKSISTWEEMNEIGMNFYDNGEYYRAKKWLERAKLQAELEFGTQSQNYALALNNLGLIYSILQLNSEAESFFIRSNSIYEKIAKGSMEHATCIKNLGQTIMDIGDYERAESILVESVKMHESASNIDSVIYSQALESLAVLNYYIGEFEDSRSMLLRVAEIRKRILGVNDVKYLDVLSNLAAVYEVYGEFDEAKILRIQDVDGRRKIFGNSHPSLAISLSNLGNLMFDMGSFKESESLLIESLEIHRKTIGNDHPDYALALLNLGVNYHQRALYSKAESCFRDAMDIWKKKSLTAHPHYAYGLGNLAILYQDIGLFSLAEPLLIEGELIIASSYGKENLAYANHLNSLASLYTELGNYTKAEPLYDEAKRIAELQVGKENTLYPIILNNLALLYCEQGIHDKEIPLLKESEAILRQKLGNNHPTYATALASLAGTYTENKLWKKARLSRERSKEIFESNFGTKHPKYILEIFNLGRLYVRQGLTEEAELLYEEALGALDDSKNANSILISSIQSALGFILYSREDYEQAKSYYLQAKNNLSNIGGEYYLGKSFSLSGLASAERMLHNYNESFDFVIQALEIQIDHLRRNLGSLSEKERLNFFTVYSETFELLCSSILSHQDQDPSILVEGYNYSLALKGMNYMVGVNLRDKVFHSDDSTLIQLYDNWLFQKAYLASLYERTQANRDSMGVVLELEEEKANSLEKELSSKSELLATTLDKKKYEWRDVQQQLKPNEAAIEMVRFRYHEKVWKDSVLYMAMIVTPETQDYPDAVVMPNGNELEGKYWKAYRRNINHGWQDDVSYDQYWGIIAPFLEGIEKVYLSADGVYHTVNLGAMKHPKTGRYLADEWDIQLVTSTKDIVLDKEVETLNNEDDHATLLGYPAFNEIDSSQVRLLDRQLHRAINSDSLTRGYSGGSQISLLPGTKEEIRSLQSIFAKADIPVKTFIYDEATEQAVKSWKDPFIVHIATHGYFLSDQEVNQSNRMFADLSSQTLAENPLLRSGLLLTNARQAIVEGGDGILTAQEAINLDFDGTELVVLSACETGLGEVKNGEGVYGLQKAFKTAGAKAIIMSLWKVDDQATQLFMTTFYKNWLLKKQSKRMAFRNAQRSLRKADPRYDKPYYWAAFVMIGE